MNGDLVPAVVAAGGGSALFSSILAVEAHRMARMRASRRRFKLRFGEFETSRAVAALDALAGGTPTTELIAEVTATNGRIEHFLWVPAAVQESVIATLQGVLGSFQADVQSEPAPAGRATLALSVFVPTPFLGMTDSSVASVRALLSRLAALQDERVTIRWALAPGGGRDWRAPVDATRQQRTVERLWQQKLGVGRFAASGLVLVQSDSVARARSLLAHVESSFRSRQALIGTLRMTSSRGGRSLAALPRVGRMSGTLSSAELASGLLGWPLGADPIPGVDRRASRELLAPREVAREGVRLFTARDVRGPRPVALSPETLTHHTVVAGASGSGKSWLLAGIALSAIEQGHGGLLIDPKADLVEAVLRRVRPEDAHRIVVIDPGDQIRDLPAVQVLGGSDPTLAAEVLTGAIRSAFPAEAWGVRTDFYLRLATRTIAEAGGTLTDIGRLFTDEGYLRQRLGQLTDPHVLGAWQSYLGLSAADRGEVVRAPMNRIMALLTRPRVRQIVAAREPKLDIDRLLADRCFVLVNLAPGVLGESGAAIVGSVLMFVIWNAIERRVTLPAEQRTPLLLILDELASLTNGTPYTWPLLAERARGLGAGLCVALQTLGRIPEPTRGALLGNAANFIALRSSAEERSAIAKQLPGFSDTDLAGLPRFGVAARIATTGELGSTVITGRTEPLGPETGIHGAIRDTSASRYGSAPDEDDASNANEPEAPLGRSGRHA